MENVIVFYATLNFWNIGKMFLKVCIFDFMVNVEKRKRDFSL